MVQRSQKMTKTQIRGSCLKVRQFSYPLWKTLGKRSKRQAKNNIDDLLVSVSSFFEAQVWLCVNRFLTRLERRFSLILSLCSSLAAIAFHFRSNGDERRTNQKSFLSIEGEEDLNPSFVWAHVGFFLVLKRLLFLFSVFWNQCVECRNG